MRNRLTTTLVLLFLFLAGAVTAIAQTPNPVCQNGEIPIECFQRIWQPDGSAPPSAVDNAVAATSREAAGSTASERVRNRTTPQMGGADSVGSLRDFLPLFLADLGLGGFQQDEDGSLVLSLNPWSPFRPDSESDWKLEARFLKPELFVPLVESFPEDEKDRLENILEDEVGDLDDAVVSLSWNRRTKKHGRDPRKHQELYDTFGKVVAQTIRVVPDPVRAQQALAIALNEHAQGFEATKFENMTLEQRARIEGLVIRAGLSTAELDRVIDQRLDDIGFDAIPDLINNQPQLSFEASYRDRDPLAGPNEIKGELKYEYGLLNVNRLRKSCETKEVDLSCLRDFRTRYGTDIDRAPRFSGRVQYTEIDAYEFERPEENVAFTLPRGESVLAALSFGMYVRAADEDKNEGRVEIEASYEDVSGDTMKNNRFVATATYVQELTDGTNASLTLVYANKPEYLGAVDEELSARLGLRYKFDKGED